jgi:hypothetical protein
MIVLTSVWHAEQALMLVREPTNPFDPCAISVQTLDGTSCGYVPRDLTHLLQYDETFCHVYSMGRVQPDGPWGAQVCDYRPIDHVSVVHVCV